MVSLVVLGAATVIADDVRVAAELIAVVTMAAVDIAVLAVVVKVGAADVTGVMKVIIFVVVLVIV